MGMTMPSLLIGLLYFSLSQVVDRVGEQDVPRKVYDLLVQEHKVAYEVFLAARRQATPADGKQVVPARQPSLPIDNFGPRFLELAKKYPGDPVACDALVWVLNHGFNVVDTDPVRVGYMGAVMDTLVRDHANDVKVGLVSLRLTRHPSPLRDRFLRGLLRSSTNHEVRGHASLALGRYLTAKVHTVEATIGCDDSKQRSMEQSFGKEYFAELQTLDPVSLAREAEALFEHVIKDYSDVIISARKVSIAEGAREDLRKLRNQANGKVAPDIEGQDLDVERFKLRDYRGKVVVLIFSGNWCSPCRAMYPDERELVARLKDEPFALLNVNTDVDKSVLADLVKSGTITWRLWLDGGLNGPICKAWVIRAFPTIYVLDRNGVIRSQALHGERLRNMVDMLLAETRGDTKK
jgi:thiol-disulfide isomerase/thioredoxin